MKNLSKNKQKEKGYAMVMIMALLPVAVGILLVTWSAVAFIQFDQKLKYTCISEGLTGQKLAAPLLKALLATNIIAKKIDIEILVAIAEMAAADPNGPIHFAAAQQEAAELDAKQKQIIQQANLILQTSHLKTQADIQKQSAQFLNSIPFFRGYFLLSWKEAPKLAVHAEGATPPRTYHVDQDFKYKQALAHNWLYRLTIANGMQFFMKQSFEFNKSCAVTLKEKGFLWVPQVIEAKSSSKFR